MQASPHHPLLPEPRRVERPAAVFPGCIDQRQDVLRWCIDGEPAPRPRTYPFGVSQAFARHPRALARTSSGFPRYITSVGCMFPRRDALLPTSALACARSIALSRERTPAPVSAISFHIVDVLPQIWRAGGPPVASSTALTTSVRYGRANSLNCAALIMVPEAVGLARLTRTPTPAAARAKRLCCPWLCGEDGKRGKGFASSPGGTGPFPAHGLPW